MNWTKETSSLFHHCSHFLPSRSLPSVYSFVMLQYLIFLVGLTRRTILLPYRSVEPIKSALNAYEASVTYQTYYRLSEAFVSTDMITYKAAKVSRLSFLEH